MLSSPTTNCDPAAARSTPVERSLPASIRDAARALGGDVAGRDTVLCPGPGHSPRDRSLSVRFRPDGGFLVHSHAGDDWRACRDHVAARLGLPSWRPSSSPSRPVLTLVASPPPADDGADRTRVALSIWGQAGDPRGTPAERYLAGRGLSLPDNVAGEVLRWHPRAGCMMALMRCVITDEPRAIHRTFIDADGRKTDRKMLGPVAGTAVKLEADPEVDVRLVIGEGVETCLAAREAGLRPVWALGSAGAIKQLPVLPGLDGLLVLGEHDGGANLAATRALARRYRDADAAEVSRFMPREGDDVAAAWAGRAA